MTFAYLIAFDTMIAPAGRQSSVLAQVAPGATNLDPRGS